jgi:hypothetical protein
MTLSLVLQTLSQLFEKVFFNLRKVMEDEDIFSAENHGPQISRFLLLFPRVLDN